MALKVAQGKLLRKAATVRQSTNALGKALSGWGEGAAAQGCPMRVRQWLGGKSMTISRPAGEPISEHPDVEAGEECFTLVPHLDGGYIAVFADGSYTRWVPSEGVLDAVLGRV